MDTDSTGHDVIIAGAGPSGLALAIALARDGRRVIAADARSADAIEADPRVLALAHGSRLSLEALGVWPALDATPIKTIHVSQRGGFGRTLIRAEEQQVPALGYVVAAGPLAAALRKSALACGVEIRDGCEVSGGKATGEAVEVTLRAVEHDRHQTLHARLLVRAEGAPADGKDIALRDYRQQALTSLARPRDGHHNVAFERFTAHGPLALLPFGQQYSVVHVVESARAEHFLTLPDDAYLAVLQQSIGGRTQLASVGARARFPLTLRMRRDPVAARTAWLGNAAQTLHPVAGQGFNLALRDVMTLAAALRDAPDCGDATRLAGWGRSRRIDRHGTAGFTDALIHVFANDLPPLRMLRGAGLFALDLCPAARGFVARRMMFGARAWP